MRRIAPVAAVLAALLGWAGNAPAHPETGPAAPATAPAAEPTVVTAPAEPPVPPPGAGLESRSGRLPTALVVTANATFWPGCIITLVSAMFVHYESDPGIFTYLALSSGILLAVIGITTWIAYGVEENRSDRRRARVVMTPIVDPELAGVAAAISF